MDVIKVLVVDDSAFMRKVISDILNSQPDMKVIETASDGLDAIEKVKRFNPDVITMDVEMPKMDGIAALEKIMTEHPTPVLMISAYTQKGAEQAVKALEYGAVDFIPKPDGSISLKMNTIRDEIISKVRAASKSNIMNFARMKSKTSVSKPVSVPKSAVILSHKIVVIGASAGGPPTLERILTNLPQDLPAPVLVIQHMPPNFTKQFAERLNSLSKIEIREAKDGDMIQEGLALIAPGGYHMELKRITSLKEHVDVVRLNQEPPQLGVRPCVNVTMLSVAPLYQNMAVGVILTGMGTDGTIGLRAIKENGGTTIVQDEKSCIVYGMPKSAIEANLADHIVSLDDIPRKIVECL